MQKQMQMLLSYALLNTAAYMHRDLSHAKLCSQTDSHVPGVQQVQCMPRLQQQSKRNGLGLPQQVLPPDGLSVL